MRVFPCYCIYQHQALVLSDRVPDNIHIHSTRFWKMTDSFSFLFSGNNLHVWQDMSSGTSIRQHERPNMIHKLTYDWVAVAGCRIHLFCFSIVMNSTPVSVCIRVRFSEYSTVLTMTPAEESTSSGIQLILSYLQISPIRTIANTTIILWEAKTNTYTHTLSGVLSSASPCVWPCTGSTSRRCRTRVHV